MRLSDHLPPGAVRTGVEVGTRAELLPLLVDVLCDAHGLGDRDRILSAVWEREEKMSTAMGMGIAIPHARLESVPRLCAAVAVCPGGVDFPSPDGSPVRIAFLLLSPPSAAASHIRALASVARISAPSLEALLRARDDGEFRELLERGEDAAGKG
ncbi:MAG TPA: PTS sugar transporter subunit IIA [Fibrobacteria bacterium]|nr:PTS sugar transporter subunit IIA [Fibrobacteria bacterium]